jgi:hypothetical protein
LIKHITSQVPLVPSLRHWFYHQLVYILACFNSAWLLGFISLSYFTSGQCC